MTDSYYQKLELDRGGRKRLNFSDTSWIVAQRWRGAVVDASFDMKWLVQVAKNVNWSTVEIGQCVGFTDGTHTDKPLKSGMVIS